MTRRPHNMIVLMSDQHSRAVLGCYGNREVETPALDALARRGTRFARSWCNAPICVPSRASLATGLHIHEIPAWDNADPYHGQRTSFMHRARQGGVETVSIGKLHFRSTVDDTGFDREILPMHVVNGTGTFTSLLRDPIPRITAASDLVKQAGPGESSYTAYDRSVCAAAVDWLAERSRRDAPVPFLLFVSFVNPHPPYIAPPDLFEHYLAQGLPLPARHSADERPFHPALTGFRRYFDLDEPFSPAIQTAVTAAYYANVTQLDRHIGAVLEALKIAGFEDDSTILYSSDHGESLGRRGLFGKCTMYEESMGVPLIVAGPEVPANTVCDTPAQLLDLYPTVIDALGLPHVQADDRRNGESLIALANAPPKDRWILSQQHSAGAASGVFAVTDGRWKYVHSIGFPPMLFDLAQDPEETEDLASSSRHRPVVADLHRRLEAMLDPAAVDAACKTSQTRRIEQAGGIDAILKGRIAAFTPPPVGTA